MSNRIDDGFSTIFTLSNIPSAKLYEKELTPPGVMGGGPIDTTTMRNLAWRTKSPKQLKSLGDVTATVAYATEVYDDVIAQIQVNQEITVTFPDQSTIVFWGWLEEFTPGNNTEGAQPTAKVTIHTSNHDADGVETAPVYTEGNESSGA